MNSRSVLRKLSPFGRTGLAVFVWCLGVLAPSAVAQTSCTPIAGMNATSCGTFVPMQDPWPSARERWWDISNTSEQQFDAFLGLDGSQPWSYANNPLVTVSYDARPGVPYFVGNIKATGLK